MNSGQKAARTQIRRHQLLSQQTERMKKINKILMVVVVATAFTAVNRAQADEPFLSPRAKANQIRHAPSGSSINDPDLVKDRPAGNARAWAQTHRLQATPGAASTVDLAHGPRPTISPKDPRYEQEARRLRELQVAPIK